jgi:hypothetical protein
MSRSPMTDARAAPCISLPSLAVLVHACRCEAWDGLRADKPLSHVVVCCIYYLGRVIPVRVHRLPPHRANCCLPPPRGCHVTSHP